MAVTPYNKEESKKKQVTEMFDNIAPTYDRLNRIMTAGIDITWRRKAIDMLKKYNPKIVADIATGTGDFAIEALRLNPEKVIGIDIDKRFINFMDSVRVRLDDRYRNRFETRLAKADDPLLKPEEVDAAVMVNTYGYIEHRVQYLKTLWKGISPGGEVLIIDFKKNNLPVGPPDEYKVAIGQVQRELLEAGFSIDKIDQAALDYQYIVLAQKPL